MQIPHTSQIWKRYFNKHLWFTLVLGSILPTQMILRQCVMKSHMLQAAITSYWRSLQSFQIVLCGPHALKHERRAEMTMALVYSKKHQRKSPQGKNTHGDVMKWKGDVYSFYYVDITHMMSSQESAYLMPRNRGKQHFCEM